MSVSPSAKINEIQGNIIDLSILGGKIKDLYTPDSHGTTNFLVSIGVFQPGEGLKNHIHPECDEVYFTYKGQGVVEIGEEGKEYPIEAEMGLFIPKGVIHGVKNTGKEELRIAFFVIGPMPLHTTV